MDLQLTSIRADQTRDYSVHGMHVNGHREELVLVVRWSGAKEYQDGLANQALQKLEGAEREKAIDRLIALHLIVGWKNVPVGLDYTPSRGEQILAWFGSEDRTDRRTALRAFLVNGDNFMRPALVDPVELGNG